MADDPELAVLTARFDPMPGSEQPLMGDPGPVRRADPPGPGLSQHRPPGLRVASGPAAPRREVGVGRPRPGPTSTPPEMAEMAAAAVGHLAARPEVDLYDTISAHDLR